MDLTNTRKLAWHNRRVIAERLGWPDGVLETCEQTEPQHPGWSLSWHKDDETFTAMHQVRQISYRYVRCQTIEGLAEKMREADAQAAAQMAEWELITPRGWSVLKSQ
jgi:hypothetical protein